MTTVKTRYGTFNGFVDENGVKIVSALSDESRAQLDALAEELAAAYK